MSRQNATHVRIVGENGELAGVEGRYAGGKTQTATLVTASGDTTIVTPASGSFLTLFWIALVSSQDNAGEVLATVKLGSAVIYQTYLGSPGGFAHWEPCVGAVDAPLVVNLSTTANVAVNVTTLESP